jgi:hypothetical protein
MAAGVPATPKPGEGGSPAVLEKAAGSVATPVAEL